MPERKATLRDTLARLRRELELGEPVDASLRDELRATMEEIEVALEAAQGAAGEPSSFTERLSDFARRFEGSHPRLAETLNRVVHGLAELGI